MKNVSRALLVLILFACMEGWAVSSPAPVAAPSCPDDHEMSGGAWSGDCDHGGTATATVSGASLGTGSHSSEIKCTVKCSGGGAGTPLDAGGNNYWPALVQACDARLADLKCRFNTLARTECTVSATTSTYVVKPSNATPAQLGNSAWRKQWCQNVIDGGTNPCDAIHGKMSVACCLGDCGEPVTSPSPSTPAPSSAPMSMP